jgi:hypothetical protein
VQIGMSGLVMQNDGNGTITRTAQTAFFHMARREQTEVDTGTDTGNTRPWSGCGECLE